MNCPRCETDAPADAEFCPQCGAKLIAACAQCGTGNAPHHRFCKKCGQPLAPPAHGSGATPRLAPDVYTPAERAIELAVVCGERVHQAEALRVQAEIQLAKPTPRLDLAASLYGEAGALAREIGLRPLLAPCHLGLGQLHRAADRREPGREHLVAAAGMFREMGRQSWLHQAEAELGAL